jgi:hypothetical protein
MAGSPQFKWSEHPLAGGYVILVGVATVAAAWMLSRVDAIGPEKPARWFEDALTVASLLLVYELLLAAPLAAWCTSGRFRRAARTTLVGEFLLVLDAELFLVVGIPLALAAVGFCRMVAGGPTIRGG